MAEQFQTYDEKQTLTTWANRPKSAQRLAQRARSFLACAVGLENEQVAAKLRVCSATVGTWLLRFVGKRVDGLIDDPPGAGQLGDAQHTGGEAVFPPAPRVPIL